MAFFAVAAAPWSLILSFFQEPQVPCHRAGSQPDRSSPVLHSWIVFSQVQILVLVELHKVLGSHSSSLSRSSCRVGLPPKVFTFPLSLVFSANFIRIHLIPSSRPLMKILNRHGPYIDPWGTPLVTGCQFEKELFTTIPWLSVHCMEHLPRS